MFYLLFSFVLFFLLFFYNSSFLFVFISWPIFTVDFISFDFVSLFLLYLDFSFYNSLIFIFPLFLLNLLLFLSPMLTLSEFSSYYYNIVNIIFTIIIILIILYYVLYLILNQVYSMVELTYINILASANIIIHYVNLYLHYSLIICLTIKLIEQLIKNNIIKINHINNRKNIIVISTISSLCTPPEIKSMIISTSIAISIYELTILNTSITNSKIERKKYPKENNKQNHKNIL